MKVIKIDTYSANDPPLALNHIPLSYFFLLRKEVFPYFCSVYKSHLCFSQAAKNILTYSSRTDHCKCRYNTRSSISKLTSKRNQAARQESLIPSALAVSHSPYRTKGQTEQASTHVHIFANHHSCLHSLPYILPFFAKNGLHRINFFSTSYKKRWLHTGELFLCYWILFSCFHFQLENSLKLSFIVGLAYMKPTRTYFHSQIPLSEKL